MAKTKSKLEKFKTRWFRWLGQMTRCDRDNWTTLLDCNWSGWPIKVLDRARLDNSDFPRYRALGPFSNKADVHYTFEAAIFEATMKELMALDNIYCEQVLLRGK